MTDNPDYVTIQLAPDGRYHVQRWCYQQRDNDWTAVVIDRYQTNQAAFLFAKAFARQYRLELRGENQD